MPVSIFSIKHIHAESIAVVKRGCALNKATAQLQATGLELKGETDTGGNTLGLSTLLPASAPGQTSIRDELHQFFN